MPDIIVDAGYADPVGQLLTSGDAHMFERIEWPDYVATYGFGNEHIPDLIRMACDMELRLDETDGPAVWAPVHAWRAPAQMRAEGAIQPLLELSKIDLDDDAVPQEFAEVYGEFGPAAIGPIAAFLEDRTISWLAASLATSGLTEIVKRHPECRDECVGILMRSLEHASEWQPTVNGDTISSLLDLKAVEAIDTIREAFRLDTVDITIAGDLEDVEIDLGLRQHRSTPKPNYALLSGLLASNEPPKVRGRERAPVFEDRLTAAKVGRNDPCPCGSGKKYKKCCLG